MCKLNSLLDVAEGGEDPKVQNVDDIIVNDPYMKCMLISTNT